MKPDLCFKYLNDFMPLYALGRFALSSCWERDKFGRFSKGEYDFLFAFLYTKQWGHLYEERSEKGGKIFSRAASLASVFFAL